MKTNRILTGDVRTFLMGDTPAKNFIVNYVRQNLDKGTRSVALCFRGDFATLYYRCHQLLRIRKAQKGVIGEFDFRHARFTKNYKEILEKIKEFGVNTSAFSDAPGMESSRYVRFPLPELDEDKLEAVLKIYKDLIDDFVDPEKREYAFDPKTQCRKSHNIEKDRQQQLYAAYFLHDDLMYYDLEYTEPRAKEKGVHGRIDLLGLRAEQGGYTLLLTELKSTRGAVLGKSGAKDHENDSAKYLDMGLGEERKAEACDAVALLCALFGKPFPDDLTPEKITGAQIKFVFSDSAAAAESLFTPKDPRTVKVFLCEEDGTERNN